MRNNILYFVLGLMFIVTISAKNDKPTRNLSYSSGTYIGYGDGYSLYRHRDGDKTIYIVKSSNSNPVSISVN